MTPCFADAYYFFALLNLRDEADAREEAQSEGGVKVLGNHGFSRGLAKSAIDIARPKGAFTIFAVVDALTPLSAKMPNAGDRAEGDERTGRLRALATNQPARFFKRGFDTTTGPFFCGPGHALPQVDPLGIA